jgi:hypothetical protein
MQKRSRRWAALAVAVALGLGCVGCAGSTADVAGSAQSAAEPLTLTAVQALDEDNMFSKRDLRTDAHNEVVENITLADGASTTASGSVQIEGDTITITQAGTYRVSGTLSDGQIVVDTDKDSKVQLLLEGVSVTKTGSAALYLKQADKLFVTTAAGSENTFASVGDYVQADDNNVDGAIFAKDDLTLNGEGSLTVTSETGHGIVGKDDVKITSGTYTVTAAKKGIVGKDSLRIAGGEVTVTSGTNALQAENDDEADKGYLYISGGTFTLTAGKHGMVSSGVLVVRGGSFAITCEQDAVHSNSELELSDGSLTIAAGDDGIHADAGLRITGGTVEITKCYEGIEGAQISVEGGSIRLTASDDGMNATGSGSTSSMFGGMFGGGFGGSADASLAIAGGEIYINASGDGVDSNGTLLVSGGALYISGPTSSADAAIDYETGGTVTGGIVVAAGAAGMAENFGSASTQGAILWQLASTQQAGTAFTLTDESGTVLCSYTPEKEYQCVVVSAPGMAVGGSYTLTAGDTSETITLDSITYSNSGMGGQNGMGGGKGGFGGGMGGGKGGFGGQNGQPDSQPESPESGQSTDGETPTLPDGFELPDGVELPDGFELPDGVELPDGFQMPQGTDGAGTDGEAPTLPDSTEMPQMPDNAQQPQSTDNAGGAEATMPDDATRGGQGKQGGFGGKGGGKGENNTPSDNSASSEAASVAGTEA